MAFVREVTQYTYEGKKGANNQPVGLVTAETDRGKF